MRIRPMMDEAAFRALVTVISLERSALLRSAASIGVVRSLENALEALQIAGDIFSDRSSYGATAGSVPPFPVIHQRMSLSRAGLRD